MAALGLAFVAGILSILSPCVLPLVPMVLGAAAAEHRLGPVALAGGLALSFAAIGLFVATVGFSLGIDGGVFRSAAAIVMIALGVVLLMPAMQTRLAVASGPIADWAERQFGGFATAGLSGQFGVGLLLGAVWAPCVGPTLGAASLLAAEGKDLPRVAATMIAFGLGASLPLIVLGSLSREVVLRLRDRMLATGKAAKAGFGIVLIVIGGGILTGIDKHVETALVQASPTWLTDLTTRF